MSGSSYAGTSFTSNNLVTAPAVRIVVGRNANDIMIKNTMTSSVDNQQPQKFIDLVRQSHEQIKVLNIVDTTDVDNSEGTK